MANYCEDVSRYFEGLRRVLNPGLQIHCIFGNFTFYVVLVPTEQVHAAMMRQYGFTSVDVQASHKRREVITWSGCREPACGPL